MVTTGIGGTARRRDAGQVIGHLVLRELRIRYRRSFLGALWALAQPLTRLLIFSFLFTRVLPLGVPNYVAFLFVGLTGWLWFAAGVRSGATSVVERRELLLQPSLPRWVVPLVAVAGSSVDYLISFAVLVAYLVVTTGLPPSTFALPLIWLIQLAWMAGIAMLLCSLNVYLRDVSKFVDMALLVGFYATPVIYHPDAVPEHLSWAVTLNPMAALLGMQRQVLLEGSLPPVSSLVVLGTIGLAVCLLGMVVFARMSPSFIDEL